MFSLVAALVISLPPLMAPSLDLAYGFQDSHGVGVFNTNLTLANTKKLCLGTSCAYWLTYNSTGTQFDFYTTNGNGAGLDTLLLTVEDGGTTMAFTGTLTMAGGVVAGSSIRFNNDVAVLFGTSSISYLQFSTVQTPDALIWGLPTASRQLILFEEGDESSDFAIANPTNPTLHILSADGATPTKRLDLYHDQTDGVVSSGAGDVLLAPASGLVSFSGTTSSFPALKRTAASIDFRLADDTAYTSMTANQQVARGTDAGWYLQDNAGSQNYWRSSVASGERYTRQSSDWQLAWSNSTTAITTLDVGLARVSAGFLKLTDGSTGVGKLATPIPTLISVDAATTFVVTGNTMTFDCVGAETITTATGGVVGMHITLLFKTDTDVCTFTDTAAETADTFNTAGAFVSTQYDTISFIYDGTKWYEIGRGVN